jgi:hypothetical protein
LYLFQGSTSGIGLAIAQQLARAGCNVLLNGFGDAAAIETLRKKVEADFNVKAFYHGADLSKESGVNDMMKFAYEKLGSVDILVGIHSFILLFILLVYLFSFLFFSPSSFSFFFVSLVLNPMIFILRLPSSPPLCYVVYAFVLFR